MAQSVFIFLKLSHANNRDERIHAIYIGKEHINFSRVGRWSPITRDLSGTKIGVAYRCPGDIP